MPKQRTARDLTIHDGPHRHFEWYWAPNGTMPGLDAYEELSMRDQDDFQATVIHWSQIEPGIRPLQSRVNSEHSDPLIVALKAGKHRFTAFQEESGSTWIIFGHYLKEGKKRDKAGDRAVKRAIVARSDYFQKVRGGTYYERN